ncbi:MAG: glutaminyl-peptide cyclotransferase [Flavobacteriaceae bacterium]
MHLDKVLKIIIVAALISGCGNSSKPIKHFLIQTNANKNVISNTDTLKLSLSNLSNKKIDSVNYVINNSPVADIFSLQNSSLGEKMIKAEVFYEGKKEVALQKVIVVNGSTPKLYTYELLNTYPHDITSYTQGLEFYKGVLYESTGQYGESKLRALDYKNDAILNNVNLSRSYFGEGLTVLNDKIYQLTWKEGRGLIYDVNTFEKLGSFNYGQSKEGWGLCNDGQQLYKTDGSENIWILNAETLEEERFVQAYTNKGRLINLNELEWVEGKIYANRYQKNGVAIINPINGAIEAVLDFKDLKNKVTNHPGLDVLNGMAYNPDTKTLFVTGKRWDKLFEVRINPAN